MGRWDVDDDEWEDQDDLPTDDDEPTMPCPYCRSEIHEDSVRCPHCEHYISSEDAPPTRKPWWMVLGVVVCLYLIYRWTIGR